MRPLELRVRNFRSYAGEHHFDFADRNLVGVVGPIGSGKSSILDAIVFALYGRTPRIPTATKTLINQRAADASVVLRFEIEGEVWEAARSIRIKGPSRHALYRYEDPASEPVEKLTLEGEVNDRIARLLGLDFAAFERSVLLAQGRFAEFFQARPADRDKVLKGVFGHDRVDRMKALAREKRDEAVVSLEKVSVQLERFDEISARLTQSRAELVDSKTKMEKLQDAADSVAVLDDRAREVRAELDSVSRRLTMLDQHAGRLPNQATANRAIADAATAEKHRSKLADDLDQAQKEMKKTEKALQAAIDAGEPELLERAAGLLAAADPQLKSVVEADRRIANAEEAAAAARKAVAAAQEQLDEAETVRDHSLGRAAEAAKILEDARAALERGRHADMAATLRAGLQPEAICPVCEQEIESVPAAASDTHLDELEQVVASARQTRNEVDRAHTEALTSRERFRGAVAAAKDKATAAASQIAGAKDDAIRVRGDLEETTLRLEKILGPGDPGEHLRARRESYESVVTARERAQQRVDNVRSQHDQSIRDEQEISKALQELGMKLADLAARLEVDLEVGDDAESLGSALEQLRETWSTVTTDMRQRHADAEKEIESLDKDRDKMLADLGVAGDIASVLAVTSDRIVRLEKSIAADADKLAAAEGLLEERKEFELLADLFGKINSDLTDSRFIRFLLDDERARLAELGSEHFQRLSAGRYRFADDQFGIVDLTAADTTRKADSLSGGETFLASLGLALALAEMVAGTGGRLDSFFLDEGFGTLDPEHLDLAMEGIETLVADQAGRLVVIVSHVPELRERIEDLIELERNPVTGDTRVVTG